MRLQVLAENAGLAVAFAVSERDMNLRGGGSLLGEQQAGHVKLVGPGLYRHLLERAILSAHGEQPPDEELPALHLEVSGAIPLDYVGDEGLRLNFMRASPRLGPRRPLRKLKVSWKTYVDGLMASTFFFALNGLVGCGHMSGLVARRICPVALMKSDDQKPYQICELQAHVSQQVVFGLRWQPCRSSRFNACQTSNCDLCNCSVDMLAGRAASLRLREYFGAEDFAGGHPRFAPPDRRSLSRYPQE
jgi:hypothetical protein